MIYNGQEVFTPDTFDYSKACIGDYVSQAVVDDAMDCLPPACMTSACSQMGEPYSHREDPDTSKWRPTFATFQRVSSDYGGIWQYWCVEKVPPKKSLISRLSEPSSMGGLYVYIPNP